MAEKQILFLDNLNEMSGGDDVFNKEILSLFCSTSKETIELMDQAIQKNDFVSFSKLAHKIKFSINLISSENMKKTVLELEKNEAFQVVDTKNKFQDFKEKVQQMIKHIEADYQ